MKHERRIPAWLLRDLPALSRLFACFWLFVIPLINEGFRIIRGGRPDRAKFDRLAPLLLNAEAALAYALWREAYRRLGFNHRRVTLERADLPADPVALMARVKSYMDQIQNLSRVSAYYTEQLRKQIGHAAHASTDAAHGAAARHELVGVAASCVRRRSSLRSVQRTNWSGGPIRAADGVLANARGPPRIPQYRQSARPYPRSPQLPGTHPHVATP
jgi:hypothetical protein